MKVLTDPISSSKRAGDFQLGVTMYPVTTAFAASDGGWPTTTAGGQCVVISSRSDICAQFWLRHSGSAAGLYYRSMDSTNATAWQQIV